MGLNLYGYQSFQLTITPVYKYAIQCTTTISYMPTLFTKEFLHFLRVGIFQVQDAKQTAQNSFVRRLENLGK